MEILFQRRWVQLHSNFKKESLPPRRRIICYLPYWNPVTEAHDWYPDLPIMRTSVASSPCWLFPSPWCGAHSSCSLQSVRVWMPRRKFPRRGWDFRVFRCTEIVFLSFFYLNLVLHCAGSCAFRRYTGNSAAVWRELRLNWRVCGRTEE